MSKQRQEEQRKAGSSYRVLRGLNYPPGRRAEPGDIVDDLPDGSKRDLVRLGAIEKVDAEESTE